MGITGLLPLMKPICHPKHVQELARTRVGIDVYGWLHKGIFCCAMKICRGIDTNAYVDYCMHRVRMLLHFHITPVLVFDGADLPMKADTHAERKSRRDEARIKAEQAYNAGDLRKAEEYYQRACAVTCDMARHVIRECRKLNIEYVVAPYEADAQLAWMVAHGHIDSVITEDSDLLVYGAKKIFFKMTRNGEGDLFDRSNMPALDTISLRNFTDDMFMFMCVCAGCDFFKGVPGLGIKKSQPIVKRFRTLARVVQNIRSKYRVSSTFTMDFTRACLVFRHQTVYDLGKKETVSLQPLDEVTRAGIPNGVFTQNADGSTDLSFLGRFHESSIAERIARGFIHPRTLQEYADPLDSIERPVLRKARNSFFPNPPKRIQPPPGPPKEVRGFAVQPASQPPSNTQPTQYGRTPNLRQRLSSSGQTTFDPRQAARSFNMRTGGAPSRNPRLSLSANVWSKFRPASTLATKISTATSIPETANRSREIDSNLATSTVLEVSMSNVTSTTTSNPVLVRGSTQDDTRMEIEIPDSPGITLNDIDEDLEYGTGAHEITLPGGSVVETQPMEGGTRGKDSSLPMPVGKTGEPNSIDEDQVDLLDLDAQDDVYLNAGEVDEKDHRLLSPNELTSLKHRNPAVSHRVEALNRMIGKFARADGNKKLKFCKPEEPEKPPSPTKEAYDLFEQMDADLSRDGVEHSVPRTPSKALPKRTAVPTKTMDSSERGMGGKKGQLRVSRFFAKSSRGPKAPDKAIDKIETPIAKRKRLPGSGTTTPNRLVTSASKSKGAKVGNLNRFRRGLMGARANSKGSNR